MPNPIPDYDRDAVVEKLVQMSQARQRQFLRFLIRLHNNDPKAARLAAMHERGEISSAAVLAMFN